MGVTQHLKQEGWDDDRFGKIFTEAFVLEIDLHGIVANDLEITTIQVAHSIESNK